jgi:thymidylate synthase
MNKADKYYYDNLRALKFEGVTDENPRPKYADGTPAHTKFLTQVFETYNIEHGEFPIPTLRNTAIKTGIKEILWIYQAQSSDLDIAEKMGIKWWNEWDIGDGTIGKRYGATIKEYGMVDKLLKGLAENPFGRRHIMNMFQEKDLGETSGLYPCAYETLWSVRKSDGGLILDLTLVQRSNDYIMAGYINKTQYVALQMMVAGHLGYKVGKFCHLTQNLHVYDRHMDAVEEIYYRDSLNTQPTMELKEQKNFYDYTVDDFKITGIKDIPKLSTKLEIAI